MNLVESMTLFEEIIDALAPTVSLNTFFSAISDGVDEHIINQKKTGRTFLGGRIFFSLSRDEKEILIETQLYYTAADGNYKKQEFSGRFWFSRIHTSERQDFCNMLDATGKLCVEVSDPA